MPAGTLYSSFISCWVTARGAFQLRLMKAPTFHPWTTHWIMKRSTSMPFTRMQPPVVYQYRLADHSVLSRKIDTVARVAKY